MEYNLANIPKILESFIFVNKENEHQIEKRLENTEGFFWKDLVKALSAEIRNNKKLYQEKIDSLEKENLRVLQLCEKQNQECSKLKQTLELMENSRKDSYSNELLSYKEKVYFK